MAQHITSVNDLYERTQAMGYEPDGTEKIYVVHGTGSDQDRVFELSQLGTYILNSADGFEFTDSSAGGQISTKVTAAGIELKFIGSQTSRSTTIDYESITTDTVKAKTIEGRTASGAQTFKLVVSTGLDVGTSDSPMPLHVNGETTLNGDTAVNGNTTIGSEGTNKNLTVYGNQTVSGTSTFSGAMTIGASGSGNAASVTHYGEFQQHGDVGIDGNVNVGSSQSNKNVNVYGNIEATGKLSAPRIDVGTLLKMPKINLTSVWTPHYDATAITATAVEGSVIVILNSATSDQYVAIHKRTDVEYDAYVRVKIKSGHALMLYCTEVSSTVSTGTGHCSWAPLSNDEFE